MRSSNRPICQARRLPRRPVSSNWPAATPTGHFLSGPSSGPSARHVLVRPHMRSDVVFSHTVLAEGQSLRYIQQLYAAVSGTQALSFKQCTQWQKCSKQHVTQNKLI